MKKIIIISIIFFYGTISAYSQKEKIAVVPFERIRYSYLLSREELYLLRLAEDKTTSVMLNSGRVVVVERNELNKILEEQKLGETGLLNDDDAVEMGNLSGAKFVVTGNISNINYNTEWKTSTSRRRDGTTQTERYQVENGTVGLQLKMIDVTNGEVIFSKSYNFSNSSRTIKGRESHLADVLTNGIGKNVLEDIKNLFPVEGTILFIDGNKSITIDIGNGHGIKKGMRVDVISTEERTNSVGRTVKMVKSIAKLQVTAVNGEDLSECKISSGKITDLKEGMTVILKAEQSGWSTIVNQLKTNN